MRWIGKKRSVALVSLTVLSALATNISWAARTASAPFQKADTVIDARDDVTGMSTGDASASSDVAGNLSATASTRSSAPAGLIVPFTGIAAGSSYAGASARVHQLFASPGANNYSISAQFSSITGSVQMGPTVFDASGYGVSSHARGYAHAYAAFFPCANPADCAPTSYGFGYYKHFQAATDGLLSISFSISTSGSGSIQVVAALVAECDSAGMSSADAQISGKLSQISITP